MRDTVLDHRGSLVPPLHHQRKLQSPLPAGVVSARSGCGSPLSWRIPMWEQGDVSETDSSSPPLPPRTRKFRPGILKRLKPAAQVFLVYNTIFPHLLTFFLFFFHLPVASLHHLRCQIMAQDLISELPDDVLLLIIGKLTLLDSVRASTLSHRWNRICFTRSDLVFDRSNMFLTPHSHKLPGSCDCRQYEGKFVRAVDQVLRSYQGRNLRSFKLPNFEGSKANLKSLRLVACLLGQCSPDQFRCLQTLTVVCTNLAQYDLHGMFTCLLTLKTLKFDRCTLPEELSLSSLTQLENFMLMSSAGVELVEISNMNLVSFQCVGTYCIFPFALRRAPNLKRLRFGATTNELSWILYHLPKHCPALQSLAISGFTKLIKHPLLGTANFCKVKELCLIHDEASQFAIVNMNRLLRAFPCLQELEFRAESPDLEEEKAGVKEYVHKRLKRVVMAGFHGTPSEIECAIYLLTHTTVLERLVIHHPWDLWHADISLSKEEREKICERLQPFCKDGVLTVH
ncbi:hypothetical protein Tsubulata_045615 [Turnera subulata]|uniref:F-box domain-containing protein n=1 Tax=Turnera subulata TaxID=218843 RepID=A0A9Q0FI54_9ROSI|nr:hypothetical protein Tsubulata_045615 [Turnera subulata]